MRTGITQKVPLGDPWIWVNVSGNTFTSEGAGVNDRVTKVTTDEQAWGSQYIVELDNADETLNAKDYKGYPITLKMGYIGETISTFSPLWVWSQQLISKDGKLLLQLNCVDIWAFIAAYDATLASASYNQDWQQDTKLSTRVMADGTTLLHDGAHDLYNTLVANGNKTIKEIITDLCSVSNMGVTVSATWDDDGYVNTIKPPIDISNGRTGLWQLMDYTNCYLKWNTSGELQIYKPDKYGSVYTFNHLNTFYNEVAEAGVTIPNRITFWSFNETGDEWISGVASDTDSHDRIGRWVDRHYLVASMDNSNMRTVAQLTSYAAGALLKIQAERNQGYLVAPMHCSLELFDKVTVVDDRYTAEKTVTGYVNRMVREYDRGIYRITIYLGGATGGYTVPGSTQGNGMTGGEAPKTPIAQPDWTLPPWEDILPKAIQGYTHDITFTATDWDTVEWTAGYIKFYDGTSQAIDAGSTGALLGDYPTAIYFDLSDPTPNILLVFSLDFYPTFRMSEYTSVLCVVQRASYSGGMARVLPGWEKQPLITTDMIYMAGVKDWTDPITGYNYNATLSSQYDAGCIQLNANTKFSSETYNVGGKEIAVHRSTSAPSDTTKLWFNTTTYIMYRYDGSSWVAMKGEWYNKTGVLIDATKGIRIYGTSMAFATFANETDAKAGTNAQCYMGSDGAIYAGAGTVKLNSTGLTLSGNVCFLDYSGTTVGYLRASSTTAISLLYNNSGGQLNLGYVGSGFPVIGGVACQANILPTVASTYNLGTDSYQWDVLHVNKIEIRNATAETVVFEPYAHKYGDFGTLTKSFNTFFADDFTLTSPLPYESPSFLKEMEGFKVNQETGHWDYSTLPKIKKEKKYEGYSLGGITNFLLLAMMEVKQRLEALEERTSV
jgi:hypothetical protein